MKLNHKEKTVLGLDQCGPECWRQKRSNCLPDRNNINRDIFDDEATTPLEYLKGEQHRSNIGMRRMQTVIDHQIEGYVAEIDGEFLP